MSENITIKPIAHIKTNFKEKFGIPRQSGRVPSLKGEIVFESQFQNSDFLRGIEEFSHLWLIFDFSHSHKEQHSPTVRPPRLGGNTRIGVFASRSPFRPNNLGLSCVKLEKIDYNTQNGPIITVSGIDLLDGTPIYDIKPYIPYTDCRTDAVGSYSDEHKFHRLNIIDRDRLLEALPNDIRETVTDCLADDPRPSYQNDPMRVYGMNFAGYNINFTVDNENLYIKNITDPT